MEPFKAAFSPDLVRCLAGHVGRRVRGFDELEFIASILPRLERLELKARAQLIADRLHEAITREPKERAAILMDMLHPDRLDRTGHVSDKMGICGWGVLPLTMVVGQHGVDDFDRSLALLREMTMRFSAEFGIRYFLLADQDRTLATLRTWVSDTNRHVRRLVSEGTRPRLPWAMQLPSLMADPSPVLPLLESLRDDPDPYVRRSVANHLNDISKDHPVRLVGIAREWMRDAGAERRALLRHACRSLIKAGDEGALAVFGQRRAQVELGPVSLSSSSLGMGGQLEIRLPLRSVSDEPQRLTIDYVLHLLKANGKHSPKVFKGTNLTLEPCATAVFRRTHRFREVTTRRHYPGRQAVSLRVNGEDTELSWFLLAAD